MPQIKVTLETLLKSMDALREIGALKLAPRTSFKIAKVISAVNGELAEYSKSRNALIQDCAAKNEDGSLKVDAIGNTTLADPIEFAAAHQLLLDTETEIAVPAFTIADLGNVEVSPMALSALGWLISDDDEDVPGKINGG